MKQKKRIVISGVGLTSPAGNTLFELRNSLLEKKVGIKKFNTRYLGDTFAGICNFDSTKYQKKKEIRRGTRAGSISIYCANEALNDGKLKLDRIDTTKVGVYIGTTEHGNVETENEVFNISKNNYDIQYWSHHHNPRTISNNPAGEVTLNLKIHGPHYCIGAACAAGNLGIIQGYQMLQLEEVDYALAGGVSESIQSFGIFAGFKSQVALGTNEDPTKVSRPFDINRNGIVVSEGGCIFLLETLENALDRGAHIYGEIVGYATNSDAFDFVLPNPERQSQCMTLALEKAGLKPHDINIINTHATSTPQGDTQEIKAIKSVFTNLENTYINNSKGVLGHCMGAAGALELAGNLPSFEDNTIHPCTNIDTLDPECSIKNLVRTTVFNKNIEYILNNSFGMLGINSCLIVKKRS